jgi:hypothetical protein
MEACYGGTDVMERSCAMARGKDINRLAATVRCNGRGRWPKVTRLPYLDLSQLDRGSIKISYWGRGVGNDSKTLV